MQKIESWQLQQRQGLPLAIKIRITENRIRDYVHHFQGDVAVSFSGGKDSTVLLDIARRIFPGIKAVFVDTGLEYPENRSFVKTFENVEIIKPKISFREVIEKHGFPVISKETSQKIYEIRNTKSEKLLDERLNGTRNPKSALPKKHSYLIDAPFKISDRCCYHLKKYPLKTFERNCKTIVGTMAEESALRRMIYLTKGCMSIEGNAFCKPLSFWTNQDILKYIHEESLTISSIYGDVFQDESGIFRNSGISRTGCMFCMFGVHLEKSPNRFQRMKITHPAQYEYCMTKLGLHGVLEYMGVKH